MYSEVKVNPFKISKLIPTSLLMFSVTGRVANALFTPLSMLVVIVFWSAV